MSGPYLAKFITKWILSISRYTACSYTILLQISSSLRNSTSQYTSLTHSFILMEKVLIAKWFSSFEAVWYKSTWAWPPFPSYFTNVKDFFNGGCSIMHILRSISSNCYLSSASMNLIKMLRPYSELTKIISISLSCTELSGNVLIRHRLMSK